MHYAVNGIRPYPGEGGGGGGGQPLGSESQCEPRWYFQATCSNLSSYDLCTCSPESAPSFDCVDGQGFSPCEPCIAPNIHGCELYKCSGGYSCSPSFGCKSVYYQSDADCPTGLDFSCSRFDCDGSGGDDFGCQTSEYSCGSEGRFNCEPPGSFFNCRGQYECKPSTVPFACQALRYNCVTQHECRSYSGYSCASIHDCRNTVWCICVVFACDDVTGSFRCSGGPVSCGEDFCTTAFQCERRNPGVPVFECSEFSCMAQQFIG